MNLRTARLEEMVDFYRRVLGLVPGPRPPFAFPGAWLYAGDAETDRPSENTPAAIHLIGIAGAPSDGTQQPGLRLEHFALASRGLKPFLARLEREGVAVRLARVPGGGPIQANLLDPDGNHLHVDFPPEEAEGLEV